MPIYLAKLFQWNCHVFKPELRSHVPYHFHWYNWVLSNVASSIEHGMLHVLLQLTELDSFSKCVHTWHLAAEWEVIRAGQSLCHCTSSIGFHINCLQSPHLISLLSALVEIKAIYPPWRTWPITKCLLLLEHWTKSSVKHATTSECWIATLKVSRPDMTVPFHQVANPSRYAHRLKLATYEGMRNMYYEYACRRADELEKMQDCLIHRGMVSENSDSGRWCWHGVLNPCMQTALLRAFTYFKKLLKPILLSFCLCSCVSFFITCIHTSMSHIHDIYMHAMQTSRLNHDTCTKWPINFSWHWEQ